jgi:hypothetical protein
MNSRAIGGHARAASLSPERRAEIASNAAAVRWAKKPVPVKRKLKDSRWQRLLDIENCASDYCPMTDCIGGRPIVRGLVCPHCNSESPGRYCEQPLTGFPRGEE